MSQCYCVFWLCVLALLCVLMCACECIFVGSMCNEVINKELALCICVCACVCVRVCVCACVRA